MTTPAHRTLDIRVLGPLEVMADGHPVAVDTRKALAILALLAVERRPFAREELAAMLWPESDDAAARGALRRTLSVLRAALDDRWLVVDRATVALGGRVRVDLRELEDALASGAPEALRTALDHARGPFLAGFSLRDSAAFDDWRATRAVAVERTTGNALDRLVAFATIEGDVPIATAAATRRVELDPLDEAAHRQLMSMLAAAGNRTGAIRSYRACVALLERELGVTPLTETTELYESIRDGRFEAPAGYAPAAALPAPSAAPATGPMAAPPAPSAAPPAAEPAPAASSAPAVGAAPAGGSAPAASSAPAGGPIATRAPAEGSAPAASSGPAGGPIATRAPAAVPGRLPMVGRDEPLASLLASFRAATPDGRVALVAGEAGIGKSRLLEQVVGELVASGVRCLAVRGFAGESAIPYAPISDLLRAGLRRPDAAARLATLAPGTLDELERLVPLPVGIRARAGGPPARATSEPAARARLLAAIASALAAMVSGPHPGLIVLEDVQWIDDASREAVAYLARRLVGRPLLLVLAYRPEDLDATTAGFTGGLADLPMAGTITLDRLRADDVARIVEAASAAGGPALDAQRVADESEGLPLYVVEAIAGGLAALDAGASLGVRALLRERLSGMSETSGQILSTAAAIGRSFDLETVRAASGRSEDETLVALEELVRRGIVREVTTDREPAFDFAHARLRDAAYEGTGLTRRRLLHRRIAGVLAADRRVRDAPGRLAAIAAHQRAAGLDVEAAETYRAAGERARSLYANREAIEHLETAIALGHPDVPRLQIELGELLTVVGDYAGAIAALEAAAARVPDHELPEVELRLGRVHARRGDLVTAASHLDAAIEGMAGAGDPAAAHLGRTLVERAAVALRAGDPVAAEASVDRALTIASARSDDAARGAGLRIRGLVALDRDDLDAARAALRESLALAEGRAGTATEDDAAAIAAGNGLALVEAAAGDRAAAIGLLATAADRCRRMGERHLEAVVENNLADQLHAVGRTDEAMEHLKRAVAIFADVGGAPGELKPEIWKLVAW
jgi:DNA-binding SARP family transcriptional activator/tetratricopeptide (TPR) repeat protein